MPILRADTLAAASPGSLSDGAMAKGLDHRPEAGQIDGNATSARFGTTVGPAETDPPDGNSQIRERNGIWVVTIGGIWRGDYIKREHAAAAVKAAGHDTQREHR